MRELSLNVMDIVQNSVRAGASLITVQVAESKKHDTLTITITDNGCGMSAEQVKSVIDPFFTTRTTRKVGLGVPLFKMEAEMTGGSFQIDSEEGKGTKVTAVFRPSHVDMIPLGDIASVIHLLITCNPELDFLFTHSVEEKEITLDTRTLRERYRRGFGSILQRRRKSLSSSRSINAQGAERKSHMKSLAELQAIRDRAKMAVNVRENSEAKTRVLVGMATCGIAAGARPVLTTISDEVNKRELHDVLVTQTGCIGICQFEPIVEVIDENGTKTTYVKMTPEKALRVVNDHIVNGNVVTEYTIGANQK